MDQAGRILLVEDDDIIRPMLSAVLADEGYAVEAVGRASEARALILSQPYALVIADANLPDGNGIALADEAKAKGALTIVITGHAMTPEITRHDCLFKPFRPTELVRAVSHFIGPARP
ncbi:MAG: response regulator [Stellaceae bacterium]